MFRGLMHFCRRSRLKKKTLVTKFLCFHVRGLNFSAEVLFTTAECATTSKSKGPLPFHKRRLSFTGFRGRTSIAGRPLTVINVILGITLGTRESVKTRAAIGIADPGDSFLGSRQCSSHHARQCRNFYRPSASGCQQAENYLLTGSVAQVAPVPFASAVQRV